MKTNPLEGLILVAWEIASQGARAYLRQHHLFADKTVLENELKNRINETFEQALRDAREAFDCHMDDVAAATFKVSMAAAGIAAAKAVGCSTK